MSLFEELKRRNVFRIGVAYLIFAWVILQIVDVVGPIFELPEWAPKLVFMILAIGLLPALIFAWAFELTPDGVKREADVDRTQSVTSSTGRKLNLVIIGALALAVILLLVERQTLPDAPAEAENETETVAEVERSIAVLPFVNMSSDAEQEFFSDGITEEILNSLASVTELKVAGRTSSFAFKGQNDDLRRIGEALGVNHILEGSVRKAGDKVRITAQLIQVDNGFHVWSETYDRELTDVFAIQDEIAGEILTQLKLRLLMDDNGATEADRTQPEVYALYLKAKQRMYLRVPGELETAVKELDEAIGLDPSYAPAFAQRGIATMLLSEAQYGTLPYAEAQRRGKRYVDEAVKLNAELADGWAGLGLYYGNEVGQTDAAIEALTKALALNPNHIDAGNWLHIALVDAGEGIKARDVLVEVTERDPLYLPAFGNAISRFIAFDDIDRAEALIERMSRFDGQERVIEYARAQIQISQGQFGEGSKILEAMRSERPLSGPQSTWFSFALQSTGQFDRATREGSRFLRVLPIYKTGQTDEAFEMARTFAAQGYPTDLFALLVREGRYRDLTDYLEERWPNIALFASEQIGDEYGYPIMMSVALAYEKLGDQTRAKQALDLVAMQIEHVKSQGAANQPLMFAEASYYALSGDHDRALALIDEALQSGWCWSEKMTEAFPALMALRNEPGYAALEALNLANLNSQRDIIGLVPFDDDYQPIEVEEDAPDVVL